MTPALLALQARLHAAGYTPAALRQWLGAGFPDDIGPLNHAPALERVGAAPAPVGTAIRLFFLEAEVPLAAVRRLLSPSVATSLVAHGLLRVRAGGVSARMRIDPVGDQLLLADRRFRGPDRRALRLPVGDPVYPPSSDSLILRDAVAAVMAPMPPAIAVLDLCTGSGVQALQAAGHAGRLICVDVSPRAAAVTRYNAALNGVTQIEARVGDLYAPVRGERFDLIIANPPFVTSPYDDGPAYHAGGPRGDRVLRRVLSRLGAHLQPGGRAVAISHVGLRAGESVESVARPWFRRFPGRAQVLVLETGTAVDLAAAQAMFALDRGLAAYAAEVRRWLTYLRRHRIDRVAVIVVVAEQGARRAFEVVDAAPRVLPIPLSPPLPERIATWVAGAMRHCALPDHSATPRCPGIPPRERTGRISAGSPNRQLEKPLLGYRPPSPRREGGRGVRFASRSLVMN